MAKIVQMNNDPKDQPKRPNLKAVCIIGEFTDGNFRPIQITPEEFKMVYAILAGPTNNIKIVDYIIPNLESLKLKTDGPTTSKN